MSQAPEKPLQAQSPISSNALTEAGEFSPEERRILLTLAHDSIQSTLEKREISLLAPTPHLAEPRGAFTTLYRRRQLRGCVGYVLPVASLYRTVAETARAAAFEDTRFLALSSEEAPELEIHLSILSLPRPITPPEIEIGRHGLVISLGLRRGLLLPQVPAEYGWDRITFLEQTCRKAGLPLDAWKSGATLEGFTAEVFRDPELI
ncbi:MAG: AmmeMemoRadiSam system protein A [Acidobacteria bacterium]|nr:AmmeMemoRadiSam system protein A [Acidobacteriota bacterium]